MEREVCGWILVVSSTPPCLVLMVQLECAKSAGRWSARRAVRVWSESYDFGWADDGRTAPGRIRER